MKLSKLDPFKGYLKERLNKYPKITSTVLFKEIIQMGYTGKPTILYDYIRSIRPEPFEEYKRFETLPGEQFQVDWGESKTIISGESVLIKYFVMVLGYSRMFYFDFVKDEILWILTYTKNVLKTSEPLVLSFCDIFVVSMELLLFSLSQRKV
ncbi:MAG: hypothetical protein ACP5SP_07985, partial [Caldisericum sp.]